MLWLIIVRSIVLEYIVYACIIVYEWHGGMDLNGNMTSKGKWGKTTMRILHLTFSQVIMTGGHQMLRGVWDFIISFANMKIELLHCLKSVHPLCTSCHFFPFFARAAFPISTVMTFTGDFVFCQSKVNRTVRQIAQLSLTRPGHILFTAHFWCFYQLGSDLLTSRGEAEHLQKER